MNCGGNMIRLAVCDDEKIFLDIVSHHLEVIKRKLSLECTIDVYRSGELLLHRHVEQPYDVLLLDIDMPDKTGFDIAQAIRQNSIKTFIIFVTAKTDLVYSSFEYQPFDFIRKNTGNLEAELMKVFERLRRHFEQSRIIEIIESRVPISVAINDIIYIQSDRHYLLYYTKKRGSDAPIRERSTLPEKENDFRKYSFIKTHSRYMVNAEHIVRFDILLNTINMDNGSKVPISQKYRNSAIDEYRSYIRR